MENINKKDFGTYWKEYCEQRNRERKYVASQTYLKWIYSFVSKNKQADNESAVYHYTGTDSENGLLLSTFMDYVIETGKQQNILPTRDKTCPFDNQTIYLKIKDKSFRLFRMYGQGTFVSISLEQ